MLGNLKKVSIGLLVLISMCVVFVGINSPKSTLEQLPTSPTAPSSPAEYLRNVLDIVQEHALYSSQISDWPAFREQLLAMVRNAQTTADTYPAIRYLIQRMNDNHSQLWPPDQAAQISEHTGTGVFGAYVPPVVKRLPDNIGYISLPQVITETDYSTYVERVYSSLKQITQSPVCGWVVDLRLDQGGNMFPMLAALGPLLGNGEWGTFIDRDERKSTWFYRDGAVGAGGSIILQSTPPDLGIDYSAVPVALLTSSLTASAGESILVSFSGRKQTKRFGSSTAGLITANKPYQLSDGAVLLLAEAREADRTGYIFVGRISPDVYIPADSTVGDSVLDAATEWLNSQCNR